MTNKTSGIEKGQIWLHVKTESEYRIVGFCRLEATGEAAVLYKIADGDFNETVWARDTLEFLDGRFVKEETPPPVPVESTSDDWYATAPNYQRKTRFT